MMPMAAPAMRLLQRPGKRPTGFERPRHLTERTQVWNSIPRFAAGCVND